MTGFVHVGSANRLAKLTRGRSRVYHCNGQAVAVFKARDGYVAVSDSCPHMGASLSQGRLTGNRLECSWHEWKFDTDTGISDAREWCCLNVFDVRGALVKTLVNGPVTGGRHEVKWNGLNNRGEQVASGVYFAKFASGGIRSVKKMVLLR